MKLINPSFEILEQSSGLDGIYKQIEWAARHCYKSHSNITEGSAKKMVDNLIKRGHTSMLEHGTVYLIDPGHAKYAFNPYSKFYQKVPYFYITTNYRVLLENGWLKDLECLCEPTEYHEKRITVKFITSIGIVRELLRHRKFSFANESTRYCNYSKDKFDNEITFIGPSWLNDADMPQQIPFIQNCQQTEQYYKELLKEGCKPEEAREVLPLCTKSELVMTGFVSDWKELFRLRVDGISGKPHPDMLKLMTPVKEEFVKRGYIN